MDDATEMVGARDDGIRRLVVLGKSIQNGRLTGHQAALETIQVLRGERVSSEDLVGRSWRELVTRYSGDRFTILMGRFLEQLSTRDSLDEMGRDTATGVIEWYADFWTLHGSLLANASWQNAVTQQVAQYASGSRDASYQPYYERLQIPPSVFQDCHGTIRHDPQPVVGDVERWLPPRDQIWAFEHGLKPKYRDRCSACDSPLYLHLGYSTDAPYECISIWMCVGRETQPCGSLIVDVRD